MTGTSNFVRGMITWTKPFKASKAGRFFETKSRIFDGLLP
jgi:hypothetical protein